MCVILPYPVTPIKSLFWLKPYNLPGLFPKLPVDWHTASFAITQSSPEQPHLPFSGSLSNLSCSYTYTLALCPFPMALVSSSPA